MRKRKSQASLVILVAIAAVAVIGWAYSMAETGSGFQKRVVQDTRIQISAYMLDQTKTSSYIAGQISISEALAENARNGGINNYYGVGMADDRFWYCNGPMVPSADEINYFLSMKTKNIIDIYLSNLVTEEINVTNTTCVDYNLSDSDLADIENRKFGLNFVGSRIEVLYPEIADSDNDFSAAIYEIPYREHYTRFKEWVESTNFASIVCGCAPSACGCNPQPGDCTEQNCLPLFNCLNHELTGVVNNLQDNRQMHDAAG